MNPGVYQLSMAEYLALDALSSGVAHILLENSPMHARHAQQQRAESSEAADFGTALHDALLEGVDRIKAIDVPNWRTKEARESREAARAAGKIPMLLHKVELLKNAVGAARHALIVSELGDLFAKGEPERVLFWDENAIRLKARPDWLNSGYILHLKTTQGSAEPNAWIRNHLVTDGYDLAAIFYEHGARMLVGERESVFMVIEQDPPHGVSFVGLDPEMRELAERKYALAIGLWAQCLKQNQFPSYPRRICYAELAGWQEREWADREMVQEFDKLQAEQGLQP